MIKFHLKLYPINDQVSPYETPFGHIFQAVIFGWLHENYPQFTHELHAYEKMRPYAINCHIHKKKSLVEFTIVSYDQTLSSVLINIIKPIKGKILNVAGKEYRIESLQIEKIYLEKLIKTSAPVSQFHIHFPTPIHFSTSKGNYPVRYPIPSILFGNLSKIWNDIAKKSGRIERQHLLHWLKAHCYISGYEMRSAKYFIKSDQKVAGGQGSASYRIKKPNKEFYEKYYSTRKFKNNYESKPRNNYRNNCQWIDLLCKLGEYTNAGQNRTAGMGVILYFPKNYLETRDDTQKIPVAT